MRHFPCTGRKRKVGDFAWIDSRIEDPRPEKPTNGSAEGGTKLRNKMVNGLKGAIAHQRSKRGIDCKHAGHELAREHHRLAGGHQEVQGCCQEQLELK